MPENETNEEELLVHLYEETSDPEKGVHSANIKNLGDLKEIRDVTGVSINYLINYGADVVRLAYYPDKIPSDFLNEIKKKSREFSNKEIEFHLARVALEVMGEILKKKEPGDESLYDVLYALIVKFHESHRKKVNFQKCIVEAVKYSILVNSKGFESHLKKILDSWLSKSV